MFENDTDRRVVFKFREICCRREIGEIVRCLPDKNKISSGSPAVATARIAHKICQV